MDLSKLKIEVYDFLAVIIPGLLVICELAVTLKGWSAFLSHIENLSASGFTLLLLISFALGPIIQELSDSGIKAWKGDRFFKSSRDKLWTSVTGEQVRSKIAAESGRQLENVDVAFDYCLTRAQAYFLKRDLFLANSDLSRSTIVVCCFAVLPLARIVLALSMSWSCKAAVLVGCVAIIYLVARLCWARMKRFRKLSETPVFHTYLALPASQKADPADK
jgi:hypothetical protein